MIAPPYDSAFKKFLDWLIRATTVDPIDYADWLRANSVWTELEDGWSQDDVFAYLHEQYASANRLNIYSSAEVQS